MSFTDQVELQTVKAIYRWWPSVSFTGHTEFQRHSQMQNNSVNHKCQERKTDISWTHLNWLLHFKLWPKAHICGLNPVSEGKLKHPESSSRCVCTPEVLHHHFCVASQHLSLVCSDSASQPAVSPTTSTTPSCFNVERHTEKKNQMQCSLLVLFIIVIKVFIPFNFASVEAILSVCTHTHTHTHTQASAYTAFWLFTIQNLIYTQKRVANRDETGEDGTTE